ncbi:MAG: DUF6702 family protein [Pseudomonadota bacterium]
MPFSKQVPRRAALSAVALWFGLLCGAALAHRQPECVTTIRVNSDDSLLEVEHRLHRHDGLRLLAAETTLPNDASLDTLGLRARLALLVERGFQLSDETGKPRATVPLDLIGADVEGDYVYVYQQRPLPLPDTLALKHKILNVLAGELSVEVYVEQGANRRRIRITRDMDWTALPMQFLLGSMTADG